MISFLLEEGVITVGTLSGLFTTSLLNSFKSNIVDPGIENIFPSHKLDKKDMPVISQPQEKPENNENKSNFGDIFPIPVGSTPPPPTPNQKGGVKWQTFLKDFITWLIIMFCLYIVWKKILQPMRVPKV